MPVSLDIPAETADRVGIKKQASHSNDRAEPDE